MERGGMGSNDICWCNRDGLTYENFRRTIIIPQGKFKEF
jgi:hypothetical protein